jgi:hypothetical protein
MTETRKARGRRSEKLAFNNGHIEAVRNLKQTRNSNQ